MADSLAKHVALYINNWIGLDTEVDAEAIFNIAWALSMDDELAATFNYLIKRIKYDNMKARQEADLICPQCHEWQADCHCLPGHIE
jgi:hypothetical protein